MTSFLLILLALGAAALITELIAADHAPFGYEDEAGFHLGQESLAGGRPASVGKSS